MCYVKSWRNLGFGYFQEENKNTGKEKFHHSEEQLKASVIKATSKKAR
jgi:hypothetical protein